MLAQRSRSGGRPNTSAKPFANPGCPTLCFRACSAERGVREPRRLAKERHTRGGARRRHTSTRGNHCKTRTNCITMRREEIGTCNILMCNTCLKADPSALKQFIGNPFARITQHDGEAIATPLCERPPPPELPPDRLCKDKRPPRPYGNTRPPIHPRDRGVAAPLCQWCLSANPKQPVTPCALLTPGSASSKTHSRA